MFGDRLRDYGRKTVENISILPRRITSYAQRLREEIPLTVTGLKNSKETKVLGVQVIGIGSASLVDAYGTAAVARLGGFEVGILTAAILLGLSTITLMSIQKSSLSP